MFEFLALAVSVAPLIIAIQALNQIAILRARVAAPHVPSTEPPAPPPTGGGASAGPPPPLVTADSAGACSAAGRGNARAAAASASPAGLRGAPRYPLGGLGRRTDAGARRLFHG